MRNKMKIPLKPEALKREDIPDNAKETIAEAGSLYPVPRYTSKAEITSILEQLVAG
jgi:hypothetical protein